MNQAGFGAFTRGELPYDVAKLVARPLLPVPTEVEKQAAVLVKNSEITYQNSVIKIEQQGKLIEIKNRLASRIAKAMKKTAKLRLQALQAKHGLKAADGTVIRGSFDGDSMYKELKALVNEAETEADVKAHLKVVERLRDTPMPDNCTSQEWSKRMVEFNMSNQYIDVPYGGNTVRSNELASASRTAAPAARPTA